MYTFTVCKQVFRLTTKPNNIQKQKTHIHFKTIELLANELANVGEFVQALFFLCVFVSKRKKLLCVRVQFRKKENFFPFMRNTIFFFCSRSQTHIHSLYHSSVVYVIHLFILTFYLGQPPHGGSRSIQKKTYIINYPILFVRWETTNKLCDKTNWTSK